MDDKKKQRGSDEHEVDLTDENHEGDLVEMEDDGEPEGKIEMENTE